MRVSRQQVAFFVIDLVGSNNHWFSRTAQSARHFGIQRSDTRMRINHQDQNISLINRTERLTAHGTQNAFGGWIETARINHTHLRALPFDDAITAIAGHARFVLHQSGAAAHQAVEQR